MLKTSGTNTIRNESVPAEHYIVAIGASAGGLEAIHEFFDNMPSNRNLSFVIIQHLSPDYKSLLVELVSKHTNMKVFEAKHNVKVEPDCIYVIPNDKLLIIKQGRLQLVEKSIEKAPNTAIDTFLKSLAEDQQGRAIAVILSGTGTDGTRGIKEIQSNGGIVLVQDPVSAKFDGMPNSAITTGVADYILSPELMPEEIFNHINEQPAKSALIGTPDETLLPEVLRLIEKHCGHDFTNYKTPTILRRISRRMGHLDIRRFPDYLEKLRESGEECKILGKEFLIGVTKFFRDQAAFKILREEILPHIIRSKDDNDILKVWVTACSTGEEAYSMAILIDDLLHQAHKNLEVKIFATDIDAEAIEFASKATYAAVSISELDERLATRYFTKQGSHVIVNPRLRKQIVFARHNILKDPPFIKNDLVSCRNMLIYMNQVLQRKVLTTLQFSLNTGGYLFLGPSEIPASVKESFDEISGKWKIYRKVSSDNQYSPERLPSAQLFRHIKDSKYSPSKETGAAMDLAEDFKNLLTDEYGFAAVYIDKSLEIKEAVGDFKKYLSLPDKITNLQLLKMVGNELSFALNAAIRKANKEGKKITLNHVKIKDSTGEKVVNIFVKPSARQDYMLVAFSEDQGQPVNKIITDFSSHSSESISYISELEDELKETRANLQLAVESLETANEELQSSNEELLSANEELQSSNEELQSLNEELHTLNTEHQLRIKELVELNDDLNNYFRSTEIGQLFVDRNYRIRKFNPVAVSMINLIESDIGRPIDHISNNIKAVDVNEEIKQVIQNREIVEKEVELNSGRVCLMRILPYETKAKQVDGVVISFVDITRVKELDNIIKGVFNSSLNMIMAFKAIRNERKQIVDYRFIAANHAADRYLGRDKDELIGKPLMQELPDLLKNGALEKYNRVVDTGIPLHSEIRLVRNGQENWFEIMATQMMDGLVITLADITEKKKGEEKLRRNYEELMQAKENLRNLNAGLEEKVAERTNELSKSNAELQLLIDEFKFVTDFMPQMVWSTKANGYHEFYNKQWYDYTGLNYDDTKGEGWNAMLHPDDRERALQVWKRSLETGDPYQIEYRFKRYDGEYRWFLGRALPLKDEKGKILKWFGTCTDIHDQIMANEILEQKVKERTQELETSNTELLQFASVASHDLKEPLRKIHMFSNLLKDRYLDKLDKGASDYIERIIGASARMTKLINDLLTFTRLSVVSAPEKTDLNKIVEEVMSDLELFITEKDAVIEVDELPDAEVVTGQMRQVFQNIISNGLKFSKKGEKPRIKINCQLVESCSFDALPKANGDFVRITITDNGIGFDNFYAERIFTIFQRLHSREKYDGTGIGLAITRKIIEKHNGIIKADGKEGEGACFTMVLPLKQTEIA